MKWYDKLKENENPETLPGENKEMTAPEEDFIVEEFKEEIIPTANILHTPTEGLSQSIDKAQTFTNISKDANLVGNLIGKESICMSGTIKGDIVCSHDLLVDGTVTGNLSAEKIRLDHAKVEGDISCKNDMDINNGTYIKGNIKAGTLSIGGYIEGNLKVSGELHLLGTAIIKGNVEAASLESEKGASLRGQCSIITD